MSLEFLQQKKAAIERVIAAHRQFQEAIAELPPEWASEIRRELGEPSENGKHISFSKEDSERLPPSQAIVKFLSDADKALPPSKIVSALKDKIRSKSDRPDKVLYSSIQLLLRMGKVSKDREGRYSISDNSSQ